MPRITGIIFLLFFPACLGVLRQIIWGSELTHQMLALGTFLFCIEQARMAVKDLRQITDAKKQINDIRLNNFQKITISTIFIELIGFYVSSTWWGWGSIIILISQVWFNLFAGVKIQTSPEIIIKSWHISERSLVLFADVLGLVLVSLWMSNIASNLIAWGLFAMVIIYGSVKLFLRLISSSYGELKQVSQQSNQ
ncbi:MAG: hypothetical protein KME64_19890 [Scytonematopsis contorta HA4267-MV1]|jgi:hypothetical protein|nr:hypothetical protein [Scytonematopsis contorta HA4267-MV1]